MQITTKKAKEIKKKLPSLQRLIEREDTDYQILFVSIFDHWLKPDEVGLIHTEDENELKIRRKKLQDFIVGLFEMTPTYTWKYKRKNRFFLYSFTTLNQVLKNCNIQYQHGESGRGYDIILPEFEIVYSEEWDWTNIIWFRNERSVKPLIELAEKSGLYILHKR
ncbi:MAG: hypothetical protein ACPG5B_09430 [Chitinophagales bacterium]